MFDKANAKKTDVTSNKKTPDVKIVKKDVTPFDDGGSFVSSIVQFDFFRERKSADILKEECFYISSTFSQEPTIFTDKEREYLKERLEFYFSHIRSEMAKGKPITTSNALLEEMIASGDKEGCFALLEEMKKAKEQGESIEVETMIPLSFAEAKKLLLKSFTEHCQYFLLQLKEISTRY